MNGRRWTRVEDRVLRTLPPAEAARQTGRTPAAVQSRRFALGLLPVRRVWTAADDGLVRTLRPAEAAARTGRPIGSVYNRRAWLGVAARRA